MLWEIEFLFHANCTWFLLLCSIEMSNSSKIICNNWNNECIDCIHGWSSLWNTTFRYAVQLKLVQHSHKWKVQHWLTCKILNCSHIIFTSILVFNVFFLNWLLSGKRFRALNHYWLGYYLLARWHWSIMYKVYLQSICISSKCNAPTENILFGAIFGYLENIRIYRWLNITCLFEERID